MALDLDALQEYEETSFLVNADLKQHQTKHITCMLEVSQSHCNCIRCSASWATRWVTPDRSTTWLLRSIREVRLNTRYMHTNEYWKKTEICLFFLIIHSNIV